MSEEIYELTKKILFYNQQFQKNFQESRSTGITKDFYGSIKPFADEVKQINSEWKNQIKNWLIVNPQKHIHFKQIDNISEQIEQQSIQAFSPETSKSRFLQTNRTVGFFLEQVLKALENQA